MPAKQKQKSTTSTANPLPFKEITSRLGVDELVKRLKSCLSYLEDIAVLPEGDLVQSLVDLSFTLTTSSIINHRNRDVLLLTACVLINLYRLFGTDSPNTEEQMKVMCKLFISQLEVLKKPSSTFYKWCFSLVELLSSTRVFVWCVTFDTQDILVDLFNKIYSIVSVNQSSQIHNYLLDITSSVIQEAEHLSNELLDVILLPLVENNQTVIDFVRRLIKKSSQYIQSFIQLFYTNVLILSEDIDSKLCTHIYDLLQELYKIDSILLLSVLPQLELKLTVENVDERLQMVTVLAEMFSAKGSQLSIENKSLWIAFIGRYQDVSPLIRIECVKYSKYFLLHHSHLVSDTAEKLTERLQDTDDKVRSEAVKTVCETAMEDIGVVPDKLLKALMERMRDKKWQIRNHTLNSLSKLYHQVSKGGTRDIKKVSWIPNKLLHSYYQPYPEDKLCVERCLLNCIVPVGVANKMERLLSVYNDLDENAVKAFVQISKTQKLLRHCVSCIIEQFENIENISDEDREKALLAKSLIIAENLPEPLKAKNNLRELKTVLTDISVRELMKRTVSIELNCKDISNSKVELLKKLSEHTNLCDTLKLLLDKCISQVFDCQLIKELVNKVTSELCDPSLSNSEEQEKIEYIKYTKGLQILKVVSGLESHWFHEEEILENILSLVRHDDIDIVSDALAIMTNIGQTLQEQFSPIAGCLQPLLIQLSIKSDTPRLAKLSVKCLTAIYSDNRTVFERLYESLVGNLDVDYPQLESVLVSLSEIALLHHRIFEKQRNHVINSFTVKCILDKDAGMDECVMVKEKKVKLWCDESKVSMETKLKIASMKLLVRWIVGFPNERVTDRNKAIIPVLKLLSSTLMDNGDLYKKNTVIVSERSRLRLTASNGLLKLATLNGINEIMKLEQFIYLSLTAQDECDEVRDVFINKLINKLRRNTLSLRYLSILCLSGIEHRKAIKSNIKTTLSNIISLRRDQYKLNATRHTNVSSILPEYSLPFVIYLISHHPSFDRTNYKTLEMFRDCLWFYLEPLISKTDNFEFLCKMLDSIKQLVDAEAPDDIEINHDIYAVCDLAIGILHSKIGKAAVGDFPGNLVFPKQLFIERKKGSSPNVKKYLPPDFNVYPEKVSKIDAILKTPSNKRGRGSIKHDETIDQSLNDTSDEFTTPVKKKRGGVSGSGSGKKRPSSARKQTKLTFKSKDAPVTSTPAVKSPTKSYRKNIRKQLQVLQEEVKEKEVEPEMEQEIQNEMETQNQLQPQKENEEEELTPPTRRTSPRKRANTNVTQDNNTYTPTKTKKQKLDTTHSTVLNDDSSLIRKVKLRRRR